jgi:cullin-4
VCTVGHWPLSPTDKDKLTLPAELRTLRDQFEAFYLKKHQGRKIEWCHSVERCIVAASFPRCRKELEMSMYQTTCLMLFNVKAPAIGSAPPPLPAAAGGAGAALAPVRLSFKHIQKHTQLSADELRRTLQSLACGLIGTRVLTKEPKGKDVADTDVFSVNLEFTNKMFRIKFNSIQLKETFTEVEKTYEEVFRERQYVVDAVIVRIMKSRKRISHTALTGEVLQQLRFAAKPADLKLRIEAMIEREYLERDSDDPSTYNYLA